MSFSLSNFPFLRISYLVSCFKIYIFSSRYLNMHAPLYAYFHACICVFVTNHLISSITFSFFLQFLAHGPLHKNSIQILRLHEIFIEGILFSFCAEFQVPVLVRARFCICELTAEFQYDRDMECSL